MIGGVSAVAETPDGPSTRLHHVGCIKQNRLSVLADRWSFAGVLGDEAGHV